LFGKSVGKKYITAFDWKNNNLAVSTTCGKLSVFNLSDNNLKEQDKIEMKSFLGHTDGIVSVRWNPDGTQLVSVSYDNTVRIWNASDASCCKVFTFDNAMYACAFSPLNSNIVLVGGQGTTTVILDITAENIGTLGVFRTWGKGDAVVSASRELQEGESHKNNRQRKRLAKGSKGEASG
jgi:WD40 repeat protein